MTKVALVTGSNKGIGYAIVRNLAAVFDGDVLLTSRDPKLGAEALNQLKSEMKPDAFNRVKYHQLDISNQTSVDAIKQYLASTYKGLDVFINNAGIAYKQASTAPFSEQAEVTNNTNYFGTKRISDALLPLIRENGRVVNVCSQAGIVTNKYGAEVANKLHSGKMSYAELDDLVKLFIKTAADGTHEANGFPPSSYGFSKAAEIALTVIQARENKVPGVLINACCPGYVDTDMSSHEGPKTIDQGADTPVFLATLPSGTKEPHGKFYYERKEIAW